MDKSNLGSVRRAVTHRNRGTDTLECGHKVYGRDQTTHRYCHECGMESSKKRQESVRLFGGPKLMTPNAMLSGTETEPTTKRDA